jgi:hypothetical protein
MIVQFLYSGVAFCRNQTEANTLSENLKELFGFPQICSISNIEPISKLETTLNSQSPKSPPKKPRKPASVSIGDEFEVDIAFIKTETTDLFDKTNLMEPSDRKKSRKQSLTTASIRNEFFEETFVTKNETKEGSNEAHFNAEDITDPLSSEIKDEDSKSKIGCTICNKRFISNFSLAKHVYQKHKDACSVCFRKFESRQDMKAHITNHPLSDFHMTTRCFFCDISYGKGKINKSKFKEHMKSEHNVGYECPICQMKWSSVSKLKQHKIQEHNLTKRNSIGKYNYFNVVDITDPLASEIQDENTKSEIDCTICNKRFGSILALSKHVYLKHRDACNVCLRKFESKQDMEAHMLKDHPLSDFHAQTRCVICNISYGKEKSKFREHMISEHNIGYECPICKMKWSSQLKLKQHEIQEHKDKYLCSKCGKEYTTKSDYEEHVSKMSCEEWKGKKCSICDEKFESMSLRIDHIASKHQDVKLKDCPECSFRFISRSGLKTHISTVHKNNVGSMCPICGKTLRHPKNLRLHISYVHEGKAQPRFNCTFCDKSYQTRQYLETHMLIHEGKIFQCSNCNEEFNTKNKLENHISQEHDRSKLHKCAHCDSAYVTKSSLVKHIAFVHEKTISNICFYCGKNYECKNTLKKHVRQVHELAGTKLYKCGDCEKEFKCETGLKNHIKVIHEGIRVKCQVCQKTFSGKKAMKRHIENVHEKKKPHVCDICNESFGQRSHLVTHKKGKNKIIM